MLIITLNSALARYKVGSGEINTIYRKLPME